ncbi:MULTISPECIES: ScbR family autoregulator-binding transcription factor [unclassified Streptomyces]|uniref:ScbR family autoregulator-binding transcription factor n=1 Tax=unclassified Streptomyces TaxID=2593676 RepID=UPI000F45BBE8|nr:ScbR family autoregulator-binding transcription factor [Streptomyces sp. I6]RNL68287.1 TetR/AcrR family transcriptional regulator [Streptomyces sp. I6]
MAKPQQDRAVKTREAIILGAAEVFDEYGFRGASISKIMKRAGVSQGAMYFHFKSKEDLARAVMTAQPDTVVPRLGAEGLQRIVDMTFVWAWQIQRDVLLRAGVRLTNEQDGATVRDATPFLEWARILELSLAGAQEEGELRESVDIGQLAEFIVGACTGMQMYANAVSGRQDLPERTVAMWRILLPGITSERVVESIDLNVHRFA